MIEALAVVDGRAATVTPWAARRDNLQRNRERSGEEANPELEEQAGEAFRAFQVTSLLHIELVGSR